MVFVLSVRQGLLEMILFLLLSVVKMLIIWCTTIRGAWFSLLFV